MSGNGANALCAATRNAQRKRVSSFIAKKAKKQKQVKADEQYVTSAGEWIKTPKQHSEMIQSVTIEFEDGTKGTFTGPAVLFDDVKKVTKITFTPPAPLPADCSWGPLKGEV